MSDTKRDEESIEESLPIVRGIPVDEDDGWINLYPLTPILIPDIDPIRIDVPVNLYISEATFRRWEKSGLIPANARRADRGVFHDCPP